MARKTPMEPGFLYSTDELKLQYEEAVAKGVVKITYHPLDYWDIDEEELLRRIKRQQCFNGIRLHFGCSDRELAETAAKLGWEFMMGRWQPTRKGRTTCQP